ncbi:MULTISPECIES: hypothetical protein [Enterobacterales]|uniref:hypothetical protein n=2 Tax=Gammaproteobacteria TaxID=1236 RepID=UPI0008482BB3|nr:MULTISPECIES: hypothetical protein [Enterobacterales]WOO49162.1 hypothetical protein R2S03_17090 [Hafnia alvei]MCT6519276.1 hypothetical protein [Proteus vulgaris]ODQ05001.1 hypothetical protein BGK50_19280 [Shigella sp. FC130]OEI92980.1 hypothetical protein BHE86_18305 [Shigella sp. FC1655]WOO50335.1 hypothetical protein R2S03_03895 [Hafnia alvei]
MNFKIFLFLLITSAMTFSASSFANSKLEIINELKSTSIILNKNLPKRIDDYTVAEKVKSTENGLIFSYTTSIKITNEISDKLKDNVLRMVRMSWCDKHWFNNSTYPVTGTFIYKGAEKSTAFFIFNRYDCD